MNTLKVNFVDGTFKIYKNVLEFLCGYDFFCIVTKKNDVESEGLILNRDAIEGAEMKYNFGYKGILLKKRIR